MFCVQAHRTEQENCESSRLQRLARGMMHINYCVLSCGEKPICVTFFTCILKSSLDIFHQLHKQSAHNKHTPSGVYDMLHVGEQQSLDTN